jgi:hypothetical protein
MNMLKLIIESIMKKKNKILSNYSIKKLQKKRLMRLKKKDIFPYIILIKK